MFLRDWEEPAAPAACHLVRVRRRSAISPVRES